MPPDEADSALAHALWCAEHVGADEALPAIGNFVDEYVLFSQEVRIWLRKNGFDVISLMNERYEDHAS